MSWSTRGPRASFPWGETRKRYFPFIPQWHMPILLFLFPSARPQLCLKNKDITAQLQEPHPRLAYAVSYCSIRRVSLRRERTRNAGTWALISAQPKRTPSLLGFACTGGKIHPQPTATLTGQKAKPQRELCLAKIHPWPKDRPLGTFLPLWYLKKKKKTESRDPLVGCQGLSKCSGYVTSRDLQGGFIRRLAPHPRMHGLGILIPLSPITHCHLPCQLRRFCLHTSLRHP